MPHFQADPIPAPSLVATTTSPLQHHHDSRSLATATQTPPTTMVYYFKTRCGQYTIYMGKDKYENEDLIKYGHPEDCVSFILLHINYASIP